MGIGPGNGIGAWSDNGTSAWASGDYGGTPDPLILPPPAGFTSSQTPGGLQLWLTSPKLLAWAAPDPLYTGDAQAKPQQYYVYALTAVPGGHNDAGVSADISAVAAYVGVTLPAGQTVRMEMLDIADVGKPSDSVHDVLIPYANGQTQAATWGALSAADAAANGADTPRGNRTFDGTPPLQFTGYMLWRAGPFPAPAAGYYPLDVESTTSTGLRSRARPWLAVFCPGADVVTGTGCQPAGGGGPGSGGGGSGKGPGTGPPGNGGNPGGAQYQLHVHGVLVCGDQKQYCIYHGGVGGP